MAEARFVPPERRHAAALAIALAALVAGLSLASPQFLTLRNLVDLAQGAAFTGILAAGLLIVLISGGIDISFAAVASVAQYGLATALDRFEGGWALAFAVAGGIGLALGILNGLLVHLLAAPSIIVTIATMNVYYGLLVYFSGGRWLYDFPDWFSAGVTLRLGAGPSLGLQTLMLITAFAATAWLLNVAVVGRLVRALGGNPEAARRIGAPLGPLRVAIYGYMGLFAGLAGLAQCQYVLSVAPNALVGRELDVVAALVLGGASLEGGVGGVLGAALGLALVAATGNGLTLIGVSSYWRQVAIGAVVLMSVLLAALGRRRASAGRAA
jgi:simple sugar transport system permease protein